MATATLTTETLTLAAGPNQKYWDLGLKCFNDGYSATQTMQELYNKWLPPFNLNLLAAIVGALYGDTYWDVTKMSQTLMAKNLQAALGINPADCQKAASFAFSRWYGLQVRANFSDSGTIPRNGNTTNSPDVVVNGQSPISVAQLLNLWNSYVWDSTPGLKNYAYGRAQSINIQVPIDQPVLRMYYSDAGFNPPPNSWIKLFTFDGQNETSPLEGLNPGPIPVGGRSANVDAFGLNVPGSGHYCAISVAGSEFFTNNPSASTGNFNAVEWITNNGGAGWHNIDVLSGKEASLKYYNQDATPEHFVFEAHAVKVPSGTTISLEFGDKKLASAHPAQSAKISSTYQIITAEADVPANSSGNLIIRVDGKPLPAEASIDVRLLWKLPEDHKHFLQAGTLNGATAAQQPKEPVLLQLGNYIFTGK
jgi:hypothetical protein